MVALSMGDFAGYLLAQVSGAIAGAAFLFAVALDQAGFHVAAGFAANGFGAHSPGGYAIGAAFAIEAVLTFFFVFVILSVTRDAADRGFAPIAIGIALAVVRLVDIPVTNASVNPARSTSRRRYPAAPRAGLASSEHGAPHALRAAPSTRKGPA
jgi:aquaporin Z